MRMRERKQQGERGPKGEEKGEEREREASE